MILAQNKNLRFIEIDKLIITCWCDFSNNSISSFMSSKMQIISRIFFQKVAHNREYINNYCSDLDNEFIFTNE